jgi:hypothetical protein
VTRAILGRRAPRSLEIVALQDVHGLQCTTGGLRGLVSMSRGLDVLYDRSAMRCALLVCIAIVAASAPAIASPSARLVYSRSSEAMSCPDEDAMRRAVATRFGYDPFFAWAKQTLVQIWRGGNRYRSRVQVVDAEGVARGNRELSSDRDACADLFDATALAISIALDASARTEPEAAAPPPPPETPPVQAAPPPALPEPAPELQNTAAPPALAPRGFAGVDVIGSNHTAPSLAVGGEAFVGLRARSLSAALEGRVDAPASGNLGGGRITSWLVAASLVPCVHVGSVSACALASLGQVRASSSHVSAPSQGTALFTVVGARVGAEFALSEAIALRVHADLLIDPDRPTLVLNQTPWTAPVFAETLGAGLFVRFP